MSETTNIRFDRLLELLPEKLTDRLLEQPGLLGRALLKVAAIQFHTAARCCPFCGAKMIGEDARDAAA